MDYAKLIPFLIKHALASGQITPEEVAAQLKKQEQPDIEDKDSETVDSEAIEVKDPATKQEQENTEGKMLEGGFQELAVEDALEKAKEEKKLQDNPVNSSIAKSASHWDLLREKYGYNGR